MYRNKNNKMNVYIFNCCSLENQPHKADQETPKCDNQVHYRELIDLTQKWSRGVGIITNEQYGVLQVQTLYTKWKNRKMKDKIVCIFYLNTNQFITNTKPYVLKAIHFLPKPALSHTTKDSQKIKIKKKTTTPRITDEGWNSQKRLSDPVEKKMKEGKRRKKKRLLYLHPKLSSGLVPL